MAQVMRTGTSKALPSRVASQHGSDEPVIPLSVAKQEVDRTKSIAVAWKGRAVYLLNDTQEKDVVIKEQANEIAVLKKERPKYADSDMMITLVRDDGDLYNSKITLQVDDYIAQRETEKKAAAAAAGKKR